MCGGCGFEKCTVFGWNYLQGLVPYHFDTIDVFGNLISGVEVHLLQKKICQVEGLVEHKG